MKTGTKIVWHSSLTKVAAVFTIIIPVLILLKVHNTTTNDNPASTNTMVPIVLRVSASPI